MIKKVQLSRESLSSLHSFLGANDYIHASELLESFDPGESKIAKGIIESNKRFIRLLLERRGHNPSALVYLPKDSSRDQEESDKILCQNGHDLDCLNQSKLPQVKTYSFVCGIASQVKRENALKSTLESLAHQFDHIFVYLNDYEMIPEYISNYSNVTGVLGHCLHQDIGDIGKFAFIHRSHEFYFTCDDDLLYPSDYVERSVKILRKLKFKYAVSWHGSILNPSFQDYYSPESRRVYAFGSTHSDYIIPLSVAGTGCLSFSIYTLPFLNINAFEHPNIADIYFCIYCRNHGIGLALVPHKAGEILEQTQCADDSIFSNSSNKSQGFKDNSLLINKLIKQYPFNPVRPILHKVCLIGRFDINKKGGIYKSCRLISDILVSEGVSVEKICTSGSRHPSSHFLDQFDCVIAYLPHPQRPDYGNWVELLLEARVPVIANLSFDLTTPSIKEIGTICARSACANDNIYIMCFSNNISGSLSSYLHGIKHRKVVFPKTIEKVFNCRSPASFQDREGILIGDFAKLANPTLVGGSYERWLAPLRKFLPFAPLYALNHYQTNAIAPKYLNIIKYNDTDFDLVLARFRLYICLTPYATFEMIPIEAALQGTPILSRYMPQSLSEYLGPALLQCDSPVEMAHTAMVLYNDQKFWESTSVASKNAALSGVTEQMSQKIRFAIETVAFSNLDN